MKCLTVERLDQLPHAVLLRLKHLLMEQDRLKCRFQGCSCCGTVIAAEHNDTEYWLSEIDMPSDNPSITIEAIDVALQNTRAPRPQEETNE